MQPRPVSPEALAYLLADTVAACRPAHPVRVALDGADAAGGGLLADAVAERLRVLGRAPVRVSTRWFLRPASLRLEHGRTDADAFFDDWLDVGGLRREVLDPAGPDGGRRIVPTLTDPATDRATRAPYVEIGDTAVLLVDGALLLGRGLPFDLTVHLRLSAAALGRRTPEDERWTLPAFARYEREVTPAAAADVVVQADDPRHPAVWMPAGP